MSKTPISSPKLGGTTFAPSMDNDDNSLIPKTPPTKKRLSTFLSTPDPSASETTLPFTPSLKRNSRNLSNIGSHNVTSPYTNLLKTPKLQNESDDEETKYKFARTPNFFSPGKKLFDEDREREDLSNITLQLKGKLSNAVEKLNKGDYKKHKFEFTQLNFDNVSPTKKSKSEILGTTPKDLSKDESIQRANLNLQNMTHNDLPMMKSILNKSIDLEQSPEIKDPSKEINIPSPQEDSAHNALMAALNRQKVTNSTKQHQLQTNGARRPTSMDSSKKFHLPPITIKTENKNTEQDAVYSLMSLSSPQAIKFNHSRTNSLNSTPLSPDTKQSLSPRSSRSNSVVLPHLSPNKLSPIHLHSYSNLQSLPPISGLINQNDETDIEEDMTDDNV